MDVSFNGNVVCHYFIKLLRYWFVNVMKYYMASVTNGKRE